MTARDDVVTIHLSVAPPDAETVPQTALPVDVKAAMRGLATRVSPSTGLWMKHRTAVARAIAFNADRYKHAVALAEYHHPGKTIVIRVGNEDRLAPLACALALAMHRAEVGRAVADALPVRQSWRAIAPWPVGTRGCSLEKCALCCHDTNKRGVDSACRGTFALCVRGDLA